MGRREEEEKGRIEQKIDGKGKEEEEEKSIV